MPAPPHPDLFLAVIGDVPSRDALDLMSVPVVSLAKARRVTPIRFQRGDMSVEVSAPSNICLLYTSPSPRDRTRSRMPSSA